ncbi:N-acetylmuramoyl-L-alanine amidase [Pelodictyon luteolum]|uniref:N-acetylmuramoyl-L-alanine amidase n=1 Tax=Chlorobium luteolum (strain DSM 273 / BCRC 81028 / 2530) TaxID=319225 RepID=Q3B4P2_CHLL3|nr:N-acetylmuramoyl-L-alanine amidase [Pelodictyon luteolum]ABB23689.1 Cell wall hydrolase/autolysin [Pelodictyon luteolum DSM 273]
MTPSSSGTLFVILDNGHGSDTPGKRSPAWSDMAQLFEWEFNRAVVRRIAMSLRQAGIPLHVLVPEDEDVSVTRRIGRTNQIARDARAEGRRAVLLSVHANASPSVRHPGSGWECWTSNGGSRSDLLATMLYREAGMYLGRYPVRTDRRDGDPDKETDRFSLLSKTICPAVLTENLFMDNHDECRFLGSEEGRDLIARVHFEALIEYGREFATNHN